MAVGDVVGLTGSTFTFQPAATVEVLVSNVFADNVASWVVGGGGIATAVVTSGTTANYTHIGIGYWIANPMNRTFINNANFSGSGTKGFTGIQIA